MPIQHPVEHSAPIVEQMEAIRQLGHAWGAPGRTGLVFLSAIAADELHPRMGLQPTG
jgi:hypothetical protein